MTKSDYQKSYDNALQIWDNLNYNKIEPYHETEECPMHPYHYFQLSQVHNFKVLNGNNYNEYINIWRIKNQK